MFVLKRFLAYTLHYKKLFFGFLFLAGLARAAENIQPYFLKGITASVMQQQYDQAILLVVIMAIILFTSTLLHAASMVLGDSNVMQSSIDLQMDVMRRIHSLDFSYHAEKSSGKLISLVRRGEDAFLNMYDVFVREAYSMLISLGFILFAFNQVDPKYVYLSLVILLIAAISSWPLIAANMRKRVTFVKLDDEVSGIRVDNMVNFDTVKYFAKEEYEQHRLHELLLRWNKAAQDYFFTFRYFDLVMGNLANIALVVVFYLAVTDLVAGRIDIPSFILITSFALSFFPKLINILMTARSFMKRYTDMEQYFKVLLEPITVPDPKNPQQIDNLRGRVIFDKMTFSYRHNQPVFSDFSLEIAPGESVALVGLSGSGKTTLVKLLMRMYDIDTGSISIDNINLKQMSKTYLRSLIGIVPQDPLLFNNTLRYNLAYAKPDVADDQLWQVLSAARLDDFVRNLPEGLMTQVGERGIKLSGGQRQRLAIARVLLEQSPIIVFDEATSSLDSESEQAVQQAFWKLVKDKHAPKTSIIIAHRLSTIMKVDRIVVLQNGHIIETGTHKKLIKRQGLYHHLWSLQQKGLLTE